METGRAENGMIKWCSISATSLSTLWPIELHQLLLLKQIAIFLLKISLDTVNNVEEFSSSTMKKAYGTSVTFALKVCHITESVAEDAGK